MKDKVHFSSERVEEMEMGAFDTIALLEDKKLQLKQAKEAYYKLKKDVDFCIGGIL